MVISTVLRPVFIMRSRQSFYPCSTVQYSTVQHSIVRSLLSKLSHSPLSSQSFFISFPFLCIPPLFIPIPHASTFLSSSYPTISSLLFPLLPSLIGIGSNEKSVVSSTEYDKNRIEVLRVMIAAFSDSLYQVDCTLQKWCMLCSGYGGL